MSHVKKIPDGYRTVTPYLAVKNATAAIDFYQRVFDAKEKGRISMPDGMIGHAELQIGDTKIMLAEELPAWGNKSPLTLSGTSVGIALYVENADAVFNAALDAGATSLEAVKDQFYGDRVGTLIDPFGHKWHVMTHIEDVSFADMQKRFDEIYAGQG